MGCGCFAGCPTSTAGRGNRLQSTLVTPLSDDRSGNDRLGEVRDKQGYTGPMEAKNPTDYQAGGVGSIESWLLSAGRGGEEGSPPHIPPRAGAALCLPG